MTRIEMHPGVVQAIQVAESLQRILRRPVVSRPLGVRVPTRIDRSEVVPLDFDALDRAVLPVGTFRACAALSSVLAEHIVKANFKNATATMWVRVDGRIVAIAQGARDNEIQVVEEVWSDEDH